MKVFLATWTEAWSTETHSALIVAESIEKAAQLARLNESDLEEISTTEESYRSV